MPVRKIVAFDFDDTLATTESRIGVNRLSAAGPSDATLEDWLLDHNIQYIDTTGEGDDKFYWLDSANFVLYEEHAEGFDDVIDYTGTSSFDISTAQAIPPMLKKLVEAEADPDTLALIITARAGKKPMYSPSQGISVKPLNRPQIIQFLKDNGIGFGSSRLHTVGDQGPDSAANKVNVLTGYLNKYKPDELIFYDDNENNVRAVATLCKQFAPSVKISAFRVAAGWISSESGCNETVNLRLKKILSRTGRAR
jgi:hypothetical protein